MGEIYKWQRWEVAGPGGSLWGAVFNEGGYMEEMVERTTYYEDQQIFNGYLIEKVKKHVIIKQWSRQVVGYNEKFNFRLTSSSSSSSSDISHAYSHAQVTVKKKSKGRKWNTTIQHLLWKAQLTIN